MNEIKDYESYLTKLIEMKQVIDDLESKIKNCNDINQLKVCFIFCYTYLNGFNAKLFFLKNLNQILVRRKTFYDGLSKFKMYLKRDLTAKEDKIQPLDYFTQCNFLIISIYKLKKYKLKKINI